MINLIKKLKKLLLNLLFLAVFGLAVFTGSLLWKEGELNWSNFYRDYTANVMSIFHWAKDKFESIQTKEELPEKASQREVSDLTSKDLEKQSVIEELPLEKRDLMLRETEDLFNKAKEELSKTSPKNNNYQAQLKKTLERFKAVEGACNKIMKSPTFHPHEKAKIESILTETHKQIYWANKFSQN